MGHQVKVLSAPDGRPRTKERRLANWGGLRCASRHVAARRTRSAAGSGALCGVGTVSGARNTRRSSWAMTRRGRPRRPGLADLVEGEEGTPRYKVVVSQPGEERHVALVEDEPASSPTRTRCAGEVDEPPVAPPGPHGHGHEPAWAQQRAQPAKTPPWRRAGHRGRHGRGWPGRSSSGGATWGCPRPGRALTWPWREGP